MSAVIDEPIVLTMKEVAVLMRLSPRTLERKHLAPGFPKPLPYSQGKLLWARSAIVEYVESGN